MNKVREKEEAFDHAAAVGLFFPSFVCVFCVFLYKKKNKELRWQPVVFRASERWQIKSTELRGIFLLLLLLFGRAAAAAGKVVSLSLTLAL